MDQLDRLPASFSLGSAQVRIVEVNPVTLEGKIDPLEKTRFEAILAQIENRMMVDGNPAQQGIPVKMSPKHTGRGQHGSHAQSLADSLVLPGAPRTRSDHFLQGRDIRVHPFQDRGDPFRMGPAVHPPAFVHIIGDDP